MEAEDNIFIICSCVFMGDYIYIAYLLLFCLTSLHVSVSEFIVLGIKLGPLTRILYISSCLSKSPEKP